MLRVKPVGRICATLEREIPSLPESPHDIAVALAILVVNFDDPVLMPDRKKEVSVIRGVNNCVGVRPIRKKVWVAVDVQVVERIPCPNGLQILVQINKPIAKDGGHSGKAGQVEIFC